MDRSKLNLFIIFIVFAIILSIIDIGVQKIFFGDNTQKIALHNAVYKSQEREELIQKFLFQSEQTLHSLRQLDSFKKYLQNGEGEKSLENIFLSYAMSQTSFMQLRFIDKNGFEKIRIDRNKEKLQPYIISKNQFQNKSNRYYFADSKIKPLEKVWFSALDLNSEKGEVEVPYRPTIRAMLPINKDGEFGGILIINYLMNDFFKELTNTPLYDMILCNSKGFTLYHYDNAKSWGYYSNPQYSIASDFPEMYPKILSSESLQTKKFVAKKLDVPIYGGLHLILQLKKSYLVRQNKDANFQFLIVTFFTFLSSFIVTLIIIELFSKNLLNIEKLKKLNTELKCSQEKAQESAREIEETYQELEASYHSISEISEKLKYEKYKYKSMLDFASDGIFIMNMDGKLLEYSKMALNLLGYDEDEMKELYIYDWNVEYSKEELKEIMKNISNTPIITETTHKRKNGSLYDASITSIKIEIAGVEYIYSSVRDITKQKEESKNILEQKIEFETIFNTSKDGIAILDIESNFINFNQAYLEMTGFAREELLTKSCIELTSHEDRQKCIDTLSLILKVGYIENYQKICIVKDDKRIVTNMSISLLPDKNRILVVTKDITALKMLEEQSKLASMGEMIGNIAHQWRQPLSVISTGATGMKIQKEYGLLDDAIFYETCDIIDENVQYLSKTIDDFRNFIRGDVTFKLVAISEVLEDTLNLLKASLSNHYIKLILSTEEDLQINANKNELQQALINIINNAKDMLVENVKESERLVFISTRVLDDTSLELKICDNGGGIPLNIIDRIFEPYFTTKHQSNGTGLGLSMSHKIITQRHHQTVVAYNDEFEYNDKSYKGACFKIIFKVKNQ
ncbi:MAG: PAS domain S-box protein [Arcobacteraceae bacterium]|nr:PAS domain S-box protein [Arcobacteraceae bacterium]